jgi:hypothetical protein
LPLDIDWFSSIGLSLLEFLPVLHDDEAHNEGHHKNCLLCSVMSLNILMTIRGLEGRTNAEGNSNVCGNPKADRSRNGVVTPVSKKYNSVRET